MKPKSVVSRRGFLAATGAAVACASAGRVLAATDAGVPAGKDPTPGPADAGTAPPFPPSTIAEAERLFGVRYTAAERQMMGATLVEQLAMVQARRAVPLPNSLAMATRFDPRLPGWRSPRAQGMRPAPVKAVPVPSSEDDIAFAPVWQLAAWIKARKLKSERLTEIYLGRLKTWGPKLECVAHLTGELALRQARAMDKELAAGRYRGPLHGIPYGAKDLFDTAGVPTTWGAEPYRGRVPDQDAWVVRRLREAGAVLLAKTTLGALAYGDIWDGGRTRNPWFPDEGSSGSSAGSASATAAGLIAFGLGTETLGSIVSPSMRCGTTGLRPTFGRVGRSGAMALCWTLDKVGPLCRAVEDTALVLAALNGHDPADPGSVGVPFSYDARRPVKGLRVGFVPAWFEDAEPPDQLALAALKKLGVELVEVKLPDLPYDALNLILLAEAAAAFEDLTLTDQDDTLKWQAPEAWPNSFRAARFLSAVDLVQADRLRRRVMVELGAVMEGVDAMFGPSFAGPMLVATNYTGHPSLTLRAGFTRIERPRGLGGEEAKKADETMVGPKHKVPHGVTLWGRLYDEGTLLALGRALEQELGVWAERPTLR